MIIDVKAPEVGPSFLLSQVGAHAARLFGARLAPLELKPHHAGILRIVGGNPGLSQQSLSDALGMFPSQLVRLLDELEARRLLERRPSRGDRRSYCLHLSSAGQKILERISTVTHALETELFAGVDAADIADLERVLRRIVTARGLDQGVHPSFGDLQNTEGKNMTQRFRTKIERGESKNVTGIVVPPAVVEALGKGKKPPVKVTLNGYTYRSTVATMGGRFMIGLSAEHRKNAGLTGDEELEVRLELDTESRETAVPDDLAKALTKAKVRTAFDKAAPSRRKEFVRQVEDAKTPETRARRIAKVVDTLTDRGD